MPNNLTCSDVWLPANQETALTLVLRGEAAEAVFAAKKSFASKVKKGYKQHEIWNAGKTDIYIQARPDRTITKKRRSKLERKSESLRFLPFRLRMRRKKLFLFWASQLLQRGCVAAN